MDCMSRRNNPLDCISPRSPGLGVSDVNLDIPMHAVCNMLEALGKDMSVRMDDMDQHITENFRTIMLAQESNLKQVKDWANEVHEEKVRSCEQMNFMAKSLTPQSGGLKGGNVEDLINLFHDLQRSVSEDFHKFERSVDDTLSRHAAQSAGMITKMSGPLLDSMEKALTAAKCGPIEPTKCYAPMVESALPAPWKQQAFGPVPRPGGDEERKLDTKSLRAARDDDDVYSEHSVHTSQSEALHGQKKTSTQKQPMEKEKSQDNLAKKLQEVHSKLDDVRTHEITVERRIEEMHSKIIQEIAMLNIKLHTEFGGELTKKGCSVNSGSTGSLPASTPPREEALRAAQSSTLMGSADRRQANVEASVERTGGFFRCLKISKPKPQG